MVSAVMNNWPPLKDYVISTPNLGSILLPSYVDKKEFDKLKAEVEELKKLIIAAKNFDDETNQKDCEQESKVKLLKEIGKHFGVDLDNVI